MKKEFVKKYNNTILKIILKSTAVLVLFLSLYIPLNVYATLYPAGSTLNPDCAPTDVNCGVQIDTTFATPVTITNGSTTSTLRSDGLFVATSTSNLSGLFAVDSLGSVSASGTLRVYGSSLFSSVSSTYVSSTVITVSDLSVLTTLTLPTNSITDAYVVDGLTISGGTINATPIGDVTPSTGIFTNVTTTQATSTYAFANILKSIKFNTTYTTTTDLYVSGYVGLPVDSITDAMVAGTLTITGGSIDGTPIGQSIAAAGTFSNLIATSATTTNGAYVSSTLVLKDHANNYRPLEIFTDDPTRGNYMITQSSFDNVGTSTKNQVMRIGYNRAHGGGWVNPNIPSLAIEFESYFLQASNDPVMEFHVPSIYDSGGTIRPLTFQYHILAGTSTPGTVNAGFGVNDLVFATPTGTVYAQLGQTQFGLTGVSLKQVTNNFNWLQQFNAAGDATIEIVRVDDENNIRLSPSGAAVYIPNNTRGALNIAATSTYALLNIGAGSSASSSGIGFQNDTNLYREQANVLATDDVFRINQPSTSDGLILSSSDGTITAGLRVSGSLLQVACKTATCGRALFGVGGIDQSLGSSIDTYNTGLTIFYIDDAVEAMRIGTNGHLLINTTTDNGYLSVSGTAFINGATLLNNNLTVSGGVFQSGLDDCSGDTQGLNYNATTGKFVCGDDDLGSFSGFLSSSYYVTNGTTTSTLHANGLYISTSTANMLGLFNVDSSGNVNASGTLKTFGLSNFSTGFISNASSSIGSSLTVSGALTASGTLRVSSTSQFDDNILVGNTIPGKYISFYNSSYKITAQSGLEIYSGDSIRFLEGSTQRMIINSGGIVGIQYGFISNASSSIGSSLNVSKAFIASSTLYAGGLSTFETGLISQASSTFRGSLQVTGRLTSSSTAFLTQGFIANASSSIAGGLQVDGALNVSSSILVNTSLVVGQTSGFANGKFIVNGSTGNVNASGTITLSSKLDPAIVGTFTSTTGLAGAAAVYVSGKYAYVASGDDNSLRIIDISNPNAPAIVGGIKDNTNLLSAHAVHVSGKYAYVASYAYVPSGGRGLVIVDISNPSSPSIVGSVVSSTLSFVRTVYVSGKYAYVGGVGENNASFVVIDISNPLSPVVVGSKEHSDFTSPKSIYVSGKYAYVASKSGGKLVTVDISNPAAPTIVGGAYTNLSSGAPMAMYISGKFAYLVDDGHFFIVDISNPTSNSMPVVGSITNGVIFNNAFSVFVAGKYAYVANDERDSLAIIDISSSTAPSFVDELLDGTNLDHANSVFVSGKYAYVTTYGGNLQVIDIGGIDAPSANIGALQVNTLNLTENLTVANDAYVTNGLIVGSGGILSNGGVSIGGTLTASTSLVLGTVSSTFNSGRFIVDGLAGNVSSSGTAKFYGQASFISGIITNASSSFGSSLTISGRLTSSSTAYLTQGFIANASSSIAGGLQVNGALNVSSSLFVSSSLVLGQGSGFNAGKLYLDGLTGNVFASGTISIAAESSTSSRFMVGVGAGYNIGRFSVEGLTGNISASGSLALSASMNPTIVGSIVSTTALDGAESVYVSGKYAYVVAQGSDTFSVVDISNPSLPTIVGKLTDASRFSVPRSVYVSGKYAYVTDENKGTLTIIDISNPIAPTFVGGIRDTVNLSGAYGLYVSGKYAYVTNYSNDSLRIIDISNPTGTSTIVGGVRHTTNLNGAQAVYVVGNYAYLANFQDDSMRIIDVSNPTAPRILGGVKDASALDGASSIYVSGRYAYVTTQNDHSLRIIDISSSTAPTIVGGVKDDALLYGSLSVRIAGKYAYVASANSNSLRIIDISSSTAPTIVGGVDTNLSNPSSVFVSGKYAYVTEGSDDELSIIDLGGIDAPVANIGALQVNSVNLTENLMIGNNAYISNGLNVGVGGISTDGLISGGAVDISSKISPKILGGVRSLNNLLDGPRSVFVQGKYAYVANNDDDSLRVIDISNPSVSSTIIGGVKDAVNLNGIYSVYVSGKYAYVTNFDDDSLRIIDVSDPASSTIIGGVKDATNLDGAYALYVSGKYAYVTTYTDNSLRIIDISSSTAPRIVGGVKDNTNLVAPRSIYVSGKYAYITSYTDNSLRIIDISVPSAPQIVGGVKNDTSLLAAMSVYVSGRYAYVAASGDDSLRIIDISSSTAPTIVGGIKDSSLLTGAWSVQVQGKYAYVAALTDDSLRIIDISSSTAPTIVGGVKDSTNLDGIFSTFISGKYVYAVNYIDDSLRIIDIGGIDAPSANIGSIQSSNINITENLTVGNNAYIQSALNVGAGGIFTDGGLTVMGTSTFKGITVSSTQVYLPDLAAPVATSDIVCFDAGGKLTHQAGNCTVSSQRFKHDIEDWDEGLDLVLSLNTVKYKRNSDNAEEIGLIAEQVYEVDPHFIIFEPGSTSTPRSVDYERLVIPLISAIQSQQQQIDGLLLASMGLSSSTAYSTSEEELLYAANRPLMSAISYLTNKLATGASVIKDFLAERVTAVVGVFKRVKADVVEVDNGIEMKDKSTGEIYCVIIRDGELTKTQGRCENQDFEENIIIPENSSGFGSGEEVETQNETPENVSTPPEEQTTPGSVQSSEIESQMPEQNVEEAVSEILSELLSGGDTPSPPEEPVENAQEATGEATSVDGESGGMSGG